MRPVCVKCKIEMEPMCNEVAVWHPMEPDNESIDFIVSGDRWECLHCKANIITGYGSIVTANDKDQNWLKAFVETRPEQVRITRNHQKIEIQEVSK